MGLGAGLSMYVVVVQKFTFAISSPDEFLSFSGEPDALPVTQLSVSNPWREHKSGMISFWQILLAVLLML